MSKIKEIRGREIMDSRGNPTVSVDVIVESGAKGSASGGQREFAPVLARAAVSVGVAAVFIETHPDPDHAPSDGPNMIPFAQLPEVVSVLLEFDRLAKHRPVSIH